MKITFDTLDPDDVQQAHDLTSRLLGLDRVVTTRRTDSSDPVISRRRLSRVSGISLEQRVFFDNLQPLQIHMLMAMSKKKKYTRRECIDIMGKVANPASASPTLSSLDILGWVKREDGWVHVLPKAADRVARWKAREDIH